MSRSDLSKSVHALVAELYAGVFTVPFERFREAALERIEALIPFDAAVWGSGLRASNEMLSVSVCRFPLAQLLTYAAHWQAQDFVRAAAAAEPGRAFRNEDVMPLDRYHRSDIYLQYSKPAGIEHALGVIQHDPATDVAEMAFLFRRDPTRPYTDEERETLEALSAHLVNAWRQAQLAYAYRAAADGSGAGLNAHESYAIADAQGLLHAAGEEFCMILRKVVPGWAGPALPPDLAPLMRGELSALQMGGHVFRLARLGDRFLCSAMPETGVLGLTAAETRAARLYAEGLTQQDVARRLGISRSTVRNQLAAAYTKLGVHSKVEFVRALNRPTEPPMR